MIHQLYHGSIVSGLKYLEPMIAKRAQAATVKITPKGNLD